jgi:hypothetical protein
MRSPGPRSRAWRRSYSFCHSGLPLIGVTTRSWSSPSVAFVAQGEQPVLGQEARDLPDPGGLGVVDRTADRARDPQQVSLGVGDGLEVHAVSLVLAGVAGPVDLVAVDADQGAVEDHERRAGSLRVTQGLTRAWRGG